MSMSLVALCADSASLQHPESMGLAGENLAAQAWLRLFSSAEEARRFLRTDTLVDEVWVASSDDVAPINLAATLKRDRSDRLVCMLAFQETGSLRSRVSATGIDASLTRQAFVDRYARKKQQAATDGMTQQAVGCGAPPAPGRCAQATYPAAALGDGPLAGAVARPAQSARPTPAFLMPVVSGSGGAGKSAVSVVAALLAQGLGRNTLLLDFDLQFGDVPALLGMDSVLTLDEVLRNPARLDQLRGEKGHPAVLAAPKNLEDAEMVVQHAPELLDRLSGRFDVIVANTGGAWAEQHAVLLERSAKVLFLVDQRLSSVRACKHALDLCARCGIATSPFLFAVNRCSKNAPLTSIDVSCALGGARAVELKDGGRDVDEFLSAGDPFGLLESRNDLCTSLESVLLDVLPAVPGGVEPGTELDRDSGFRLFKGKRPRKRRRGST